MHILTNRGDILHLAFSTYLCVQRITLARSHTKSFLKENTNKMMTASSKKRWWKRRWKRRWEGEGECYGGGVILFSLYSSTLTVLCPISFLLSCKTKGRGYEGRGGYEGREGAWWDGRDKGNQGREWGSAKVHDWRKGKLELWMLQQKSACCLRQSRMGMRSRGIRRRR